MGKNFFKDWSPAMIAEHNRKIAAKTAGSLTRIPAYLENLTPENMEELFHPNVPKPKPELINVARNDARYKIPAFTPVTFNLLDYEREEIRKFVPIVPMGAVRSNRHTKNEAVDRYHAWMNQVRFFFKEFGDLIVPDEIQIKALFPTKIKERWSFPHRFKCDSDNIQKAVIDSLFKQDCSIWSMSIQKFWCEPGQEGMNVILVYFRKKAG